MIKVNSTLDVYETDGQEVRELNGPKINVGSHWNRPTLVVLEVDGKRYTVSAADLDAAVRNATNNNR